jgi:hypothetical protein
MLYTLIIFACLTAQPDRCRNYEQTVNNLAPHPGVAHMQAQALVADWRKQHPELEYKHFDLRAGRGA